MVTQDADGTEVKFSFVTKIETLKAYRIHAFVKIYVVEATGLSRSGKRF